MIHILFFKKLEHLTSKFMIFNSEEKYKSTYRGNQLVFIDNHWFTEWFTGQFS